MQMVDKQQLIIGSSHNNFGKELTRKWCSLLFLVQEGREKGKETRGVERRKESKRNAILKVTMIITKKQKKFRD